MAAPSHQALSTTGMPRPYFAGTGGQLFGQLIVGYLLTLITLGLYLPWFVCRLQRYMAEQTTIGPTGRGQLQLSFTGTGGRLFGTYLAGFFLTILTAGIYGPWFLAKLMKFFTDNTRARAEDGTEYGLRLDVTGGQLFGTIVLGYLLMIVTLGIYMPWFFCKLHKLVASHTQIVENGERVGRFDFVGRGGELFGTFLLGYLLTIVTFGIYGAWFQVTMYKFFSRNTQVIVRDRIYRGDFLGTGGELFVITLLGTILTICTLGIYMFWYMARLLRFQINHLVVIDTGTSAGENMPRAVVHRGG